MTVYWAVKLGGQSTDGEWSRANAAAYPGARGDRMLFATRQAALEEAAKWSDGWRARLVQVTKKPKAPPPLKVGEFMVKQCEVLGNLMHCGRCETLWKNHYVSKELRRRGGIVGRIGAMFNVDEKCRVVRMSLIEQWSEDM